MDFSDIRGVQHQQYELRASKAAKELFSSRFDNCSISKVAAGVRTEQADARMPCLAAGNVLRQIKTPYC
jgi:hypothetical protein